MRAKRAVAELWRLAWARLAEIQSSVLSFVFSDGISLHLFDDVLSYFRENRNGRIGS